MGGVFAVLDEVIGRVMDLAAGRIGLDTPISVRVLSPVEAIGSPEWDFPLLKGKEKLMEAEVLGARGQAFSPFARDFNGTVGELLSMDSRDPYVRSLKVAFANGAVRLLGLDGRTVHCRDSAPTKCALEFKAQLRERLGPEGNVVILGLQRAILWGAVEAVGPQRVRVLDLQDENIGLEVHSVTVLDGSKDLERALEGAKAALVTGSSFANGTFEGVAKACGDAGCQVILYGTTGAALSALMGVERWCFFGE
ncbi:MAG: DUF364 domain-containing protein [Thermanaerothrix sp.]|nr:DUF364 domain-containing protein [Thermanaerothrix sp.]